MRQGEVNSRFAALASVCSEGQPLLKQLDSLDRAIDRKMRLLLRLREAGERRRRESARRACEPQTRPATTSPEVARNYSESKERTGEVAENKRPVMRGESSEANRRPEVSPPPAARTPGGQSSTGGPMG